jgi:uridine kinase
MPAEAKITRYEELAVRLAGLPSARSRLVAVDGPGGAGKSFFAQRLSEALSSAPVVQTDDFATGEPAIEWWPRLEREVIQPLLSGRAARYQRFDWNRRALAEWRDVPAAPVVIIEGVSSARREVAPHLALAVWVHAPRAVRLARGLERDGEAARSAWERWMEEEDAHFRSDKTMARCNLFVHGAPTSPHDLRQEFVQLTSCEYE